jgi:hypothetical protein
MPDRAVWSPDLMTFISCPNVENVINVVECGGMSVRMRRNECENVEE